MNFLQSNPDRLYARSTVAHAADEAAKACVQSIQVQHIVERWLGRLFHLHEQVGAANFIGIKEQGGIAMGAGIIPFWSLSWDGIQVFFQPLIR